MMQRFFHEDRYTGIHQRHGDVEMGDRRHGNRRRIQSIGRQIAQVHEPGRTEPAANLFGTTRLDIDNADKVDIVHPGQEPA